MLKLRLFALMLFALPLAAQTPQPFGTPVIGGSTPAPSSPAGGNITPTTCPTGQYGNAVSSSGLTCSQITADQIGVAFVPSISGAGGTLEIGATLVNPVFSVTYTGGTPASASISNTAGINSPFALTSPFTSTTVTGSFTLSAPGNICFSVTATSTAPVTKTSGNACENYTYRIFGGGGGNGAVTGATASGTTATLTGNGATLASLGLSISQVNLTFGPFNLSNQYLHLLLIGCSHSLFTDPASLQSFPFNTGTPITLPNANGVNVPMCDYQSVNAVNNTSQSVKVGN